MEQQRTSVKQKDQERLNTHTICVSIAMIIYIVVFIEDYYENVM